MVEMLVVMRSERGSGSDFRVMVVVVMMLMLMNVVGPLKAENVSRR